MKVTLLRGKSSVLKPPRPPGPSIPAMLAAAEDRFGERVAVRDGATTLTYAELGGRRPHLRRRPGRASGVEPGDRVAIWCLELRRVGGGRARHLSPPAPSWSRSTRGSRAPRRRHPRPQRGPRAGHGHRLPGTDYVAMLEGTACPLPALETVGHGAGPRQVTAEAVAWDDFLGRATPRRGVRGAAPQRRAGPRRPVRHPLHLGDDGRAQGRRHDPRPHADRGHRLGRHDRAERRRRLPAGQPLLPHVRPEGGDPGQRRRRGDDAARAGVRRRTRARTASRRSGSPSCPGAPTIYQAHPRPSRPRRARPLDPARRGDRRGRHPGRADPPGPRRSCRSRPSSPATGSPRAAPPARRSEADDAEADRHHRRAARARVRGAHRRRASATSRRARRARSCCAAAA